MVSYAGVARDLPRAFGPYVLWRLLGKGGYGQVFMARRLDDASKIPTSVVVKILRKERMNDREFVERFRHEARIAVRIHSPHIAMVHESGAVGDELFIAMEYIRGRPLSRVLADLGRREQFLSAAKVVELCAGGLRGLADLHAALDPDTGAPLRIVHRDVSPKNLIISRSDGMKLIDLGEIGRASCRERV